MHIAILFPDPDRLTGHRQKRIDDVREIHRLLTVSGSHINIRRRVAPAWARDCARAALYRMQVDVIMLWMILVRVVRFDPWLQLHRAICPWARNFDGMIVAIGGFHNTYHRIPVLVPF